MARHKAIKRKRPVRRPRTKAAGKARLAAAKAQAIGWTKASGKVHVRGYTRRRPRKKK